MLAHEWAHLSGYAPESDASFVGLLAALRAGPAAEYSAWLDLVSESVNQLQPVTQRIVLEKLAQGPRDDQAAIRERLKKLVRPVEQVAWSSYDRMLKSQGVDEGVKSYSRVIQLLIGTDALHIKTAGPQDRKTSPMKTRVIQVDRDGPIPPPSKKRPPHCATESSSCFRPKRSTDSARTRSIRSRCRKFSTRRSGPRTIR